MRKLLWLIPLLLIPFANAEVNETGLSEQETGLMIPLAFFFALGSAIIFFILPQRKERSIAKFIIGLGIAIAIMGIIFIFIDLATYTSINFAFWKVWINATDHEIIATAFGAVLILLLTAAGVYYTRDHKEERDILIGGFIALVLWAIFMLYPVAVA